MDEESPEQRQFYGYIREYTITFLLLTALYTISYIVVSKYKQRNDCEDYYSGEEDALVCRIITWLSSFTLSVSLGAVFLLPMTIVSNEILVYYPGSYYVKWLNASLIRGLWNQVFLGSNGCLFVLLPFAYFFSEAEGFSGSKKGILPRVYESLVVLALLVLILGGLAWLGPAANNLPLLTDYHSWLLYIPLLYSFISLIGVLLLTVCTPLGISHLFTVLGQILTRPQFPSPLAHRNLEEIKLEETDLTRRINKRSNIIAGDLSNASLTVDELNDTLSSVRQERHRLEQIKKSSSLERNFLYPLCFFMLLAMTVVSLLLVGFNSVYVLFKGSSKPRGAQENLFGKDHASFLGPLGAIIEVVIILYFMMASVVGFYSTPGLSKLQPELHSTSMIKIISNCIVLLILSSALPVMSRALGITKFDLLGHFGDIKWIRNWWLVLSYNIVFGSFTGLVIIKRVTSTLLREASRALRMYKWRNLVFIHKRNRLKSSHSD
ncbi:limb region 1 protein homolog [Dysidea avara]|uniref:limb region 1 protein homolog n=1 Tax=Dysidea avara TaxID=196820 RepID=UPI00332D3F8F